MVVACYAAVHYVNAYLWERQRYEPSNHDARVRAVARAADLNVALDAYENLRTLAFLARYRPQFRLSPANAERALQIDLARVEQSVLATLNPAR